MKATKRDFFALCMWGIYILFFSSCVPSDNTLKLENIYESYWESDISTVMKDFKINQNTFSLEESDGLIKAYTSKKSSYIFLTIQLNYYYIFMTIL